MGKYNNYNISGIDLMVCLQKSVRQTRLVMQVHIDRGGQRLGPYSIEEVTNHLAEGTLQATDLGWADGMPEWLPLPQALGVIGANKNALAGQTATAKNTKLTIGIGVCVSVLVLAAIGFFVIKPRISSDGEGGVADQGNATEKKTQAANAKGQKKSDVIPPWAPGFSSLNLDTLFKEWQKHVHDQNYRAPVAWCDAIAEEARRRGGVDKRDPFYSYQHPDTARLKPALGTPSQKNVSHYAFNKALSGQNLLNYAYGNRVFPIPEFKGVVAFFECDLGWNGVGGLSDALSYMDKYNLKRIPVVCLDGYKQLCYRTELGQLKWK